MPPGDSREIERERGFQGTAWDRAHFGYFSDPKAARGLVETILANVSRTRPALIADLGGGTGFVLEELIRKGLDPEIELVNLDISPRQLDAVSNPRIRRLRESAVEFRREQLLEGEGSILFVMRSVLHYLGREGLLAGLRHIRSRMRPGEYFIHQTACFRSARAAGCLNALYAALGSPKRYPTVSTLSGVLAETGFRVDRTLGCPPLVLTAGDLARRYGLKDGEMERIGRRIREGCGRLEGVFEPDEGGFTAYLHYRVFETRAA